MSPASLSILIFTVCLATSAPGLVLRTYSPSSHDRFIGFPSAPTPNAAFIHSSVDLTGVGFHTGDTRKQYTLISPQYFVGANHFRPPIGSTIRFVTASGALVDRSVEALDAMPNSDGDATDLLLGRLSAPIDASSGIQFLPYLNLATEGAYVGRDLTVLGKLARGGVGRIAAIADFGGDPVTGASGINNTRTMQFTYSTIAGTNDDAYAEGGDSGSPSLAVSSGVAAIVGTHTAVLQALGTITTVDAFVPFYIDELNAEMESDGYHMTAATPGSASLSISQQLPSGTVRAGYPVPMTLAVGNVSSATDANNLKLVQSISTAVELGSVSGTLWVAEGDVGEIKVRKGGLAAGATSPLSVTLTFPDPGTFASTVSLNYDEEDEEDPVISNANITVVESYLSWSRDLANPDGDADPDGDGASNLLEYALEGDPDRPSTDRFPRTASVVVDDELRVNFTYLRRTDAAQRALTYTVEASDSLTQNSWVDWSDDIVASSVTPAGDGFELVEAQFLGDGVRRFFRLRVDLDE